MAMATKEQERKALEKIRKIVTDLGEDSYLGIAFEGCFEDAERNIEDDFGCSMSQRWKSAEKRADDLGATVTSQEQEIRENHQEIADLVSEVESLKKELKAEKAKRIDEATFKRLWLLADNEVDAMNEQIMSAAATIAEGVRESTKYAKAIDGMAWLFHRKKDMEDLVGRLDKYGEKMGYC